MTDVGGIDDMMKWLEGDAQVEMGSKEKPSHGEKKAEMWPGRGLWPSGAEVTCAPFLSGG